MEYTLKWQFLGKSDPHSTPKSVLCILCAAIYMLFILDYLTWGVVKFIHRV